MGSSPVPAQPQATHKDPVLAAILNLFFGIGYLYLGYTTVLGLPTIAFIILAVIAYALIGYFTLGIVSLLLAILLAYDGYQKGKGLKGFIDAKMA